MFDDLSETVLRKMAANLAEMSFESITITRSTKADGPKIIYVNDAFTDLTGYEAEDVLGETPGVLQGPKTEQEVLDRLGRRLAAGEVFHGQTVNYRKDGSEFMMEWKVMPVGSGEKPVGEEGATHHVAVQREALDHQKEG